MISLNQGAFDKNIHLAGWTNLDLYSVQSRMEGLNN